MIRRGRRAGEQRRGRVVAAAAVALVGLVVGIVGPSATGVGASASRAASPPALADGLVVPRGARLVGTVFASSSKETGPGRETRPGIPDGWTAHLTFDGDPFVALDDLAAQVRTKLGAPLPGSADGCLWERPPSSPAPADPRAEVRSRFVTRTSLGFRPVGLTCYVGAARQTARFRQRIGLHVSWMKGQVAFLEVRATWTDLRRDPGVVEPRGWATTVLRQASNPGDPVPTPGPGRGPAGASRYLPATVPGRILGAGTPFGIPVNCWARGGYARPTVPVGARLIGEGLGEDHATVLRLLPGNSPREVITRLRRQFEARPRPGSDRGVIEVASLASGARILEYEIVQPAGGGGCSVRSSVDGRHLLVQLHPD